MAMHYSIFSMVCVAPSFSMRVEAIMGSLYILSIYLCLSLMILFLMFEIVSPLLFSFVHFHFIVFWIRFLPFVSDLNHLRFRFLDSFLMRIFVVLFSIFFLRFLCFLQLLSPLRLQFRKVGQFLDLLVCWAVLFSHSSQNIALPEYSFWCCLCSLSFMTRSLCLFEYFWKGNERERERKGKGDSNVKEKSSVCLVVRLSFLPSFSNSFPFISWFCSSVVFSVLRFSQLSLSICSLSTHLPLPSCLICSCLFDTVFVWISFLPPFFLSRLCFLLSVVWLPAWKLCQICGNYVGDVKLHYQYEHSKSLSEVSGSDLSRLRGILHLVSASMNSKETSAAFSTIVSVPASDSSAAAPSVPPFQWGPSAESGQHSEYTQYLRIRTGLPENFLHKSTFHLYSVKLLLPFHGFSDVDVLRQFVCICTASPLSELFTSWLSLFVSGSI